MKHQTNKTPANAVHIDPQRASVSSMQGPFVILTERMLQHEAQTNPAALCPPAGACFGYRYYPQRLGRQRAGHLCGRIHKRSAGGFSVGSRADHLTADTIHIREPLNKQPSFSAARESSRFSHGSNHSVRKQPINLCISAPFPEKGQTAPISGCGKFSPGDCKGV